MTSYYMPSDSKIGVGYQVHAFANYLQDRGHEVTVFTPCPPTDGARYTTVRVGLPARLRTFAWAFALRRIDFSSFDVLHAHGDDYWLWRRRAPVHIRTMHGSCFAEAVKIPRLREKFRMVLLGLGETLATVVADRTVVVSPDTRRYMPWVRTVIPNGVDERVFHPDESQRLTEPTILFVGTYQNRKRGRLLADVFAREIRPELPDARLVMVCSDAPPAPGVTVTGRVDEPDLARWYRRAWVFCLPSTYEGFGIPYAEALASGTPVVATPNPGAQYVIGDSPGGSLVADADLGAALLRLLTDEDALKAAREAALERATTFTMAAVGAAYEALYEAH